MNSAPETTHDLIIQSARAALDLQRDDGAFPPGHAGAYDYPLTPVRTTGSWLVTLAKAYEITREETFATAARSAIEYLLCDESRPHSYTFQARRTEKKDKCDGLVGQAAPICGLAYAGRSLEYDDALTAAKTVFDLLPFCHELGLWERVEIDGTKLSFDRTLNHQIIFAGSAIPLAQQFDSVADTCITFLDRLAANIDLHSDGLPRHYVHPPLVTTLSIAASAPRHWSLLWNEAAIRYHSRSAQRRRKEIGYFPVIAAELGRLKRQWPEHEFWTSNTLVRLLSFLESEEYRCVLNGKMDLGSVTPWLDHATTTLAFRESSVDEVGAALTKSVRQNYDVESGLLAKDTQDPDFQATAVSDLAFLPDVRLRTDEFD